MDENIRRAAEQALSQAMEVLTRRHMDANVCIHRKDWVEAVVLLDEAHQQIGHIHDLCTMLGHADPGNTLARHILRHLDPIHESVHDDYEMVYMLVIFVKANNIPCLVH